MLTEGEHVNCDHPKGQRGIYLGHKRRWGTPTRALPEILGSNSVSYTFEAYGIRLGFIKKYPTDFLANTNRGYLAHRAGSVLRNSRMTEDYLNIKKTLEERFAGILFNPRDYSFYLAIHA